MKTIADAWNWYQATKRNLARMRRLDGKRIVSVSRDNTVRVWDADKGREIFSLKGHSTQVLSVAYSPDGKRIVSASWGTVNVWDADKRQ